MWLSNVVALVGLTFSIGCITVRGTSPVSINQETPRALYGSLHKTISTNDYASQLACYAPRYQSSLDAFLVVSKEYTDKRTAVAELIREAIGEEEAVSFLSTNYSGNMSPFAEVAKEGEVDWDRVKITVKGPEAWAKIGGRHALLRAKLIGGKWFIVPNKETRLAPSLSGFAARYFYQDLLKRLRETEEAIKSGKVNKENYREKFWNDGIEPRGDRGVDGVTIQILPDHNSIAYQRGQALTFRVITWDLEDQRVAWLVPRGGLGENVTLEIDGAVVPLVQKKAERIVGVGYANMQGFWILTIPEALRLAPGWHSIRYAVVSPGGSYRMGPGRDVSLANGTFRSNVLKFVIKR